MKKPAGLSLFLLLLCAGCSSDVVFQQDTAIPEGNWARTFKPSFTFEVQDTTARLDVYLDVRHTGDYPFSNLYLFTTLEGPQGRMVTDTVECTLADPTGRWYGKGTGFIRSDRFKAHVLYRMGDRFPHAGRWTFTLEQAMRTEALHGVLDVGISVEKAAARR